MDIQVGHMLQSSEIYGPGIDSYSGFKDVRWRVRDVGTRNTGRLAQVPQPPPMTFLSNGKQPKVWKALLLGGEPLQQPEAVYHLIQGAKDLGLSVFLYTGYEPEEFTICYAIMFQHE